MFNEQVFGVLVVGHRCCEFVHTGSGEGRERQKIQRTCHCLQSADIVVQETCKSRFPEEVTEHGEEQKPES